MLQCTCKVSLLIYAWFDLALRKVLRQSNWNWRDCKLSEAREGVCLTLDIKAKRPFFCCCNNPSAFSRQIGSWMPDHMRPTCHAFREFSLLYEPALFLPLQVLDYLLPEMENRRGKLVVVLAGYQEQMEGLMAHNEGLPSRFALVSQCCIPHTFCEWAEHVSVSRKGPGNRQSTNLCPRL